MIFVNLCHTHSKKMHDKRTSFFLDKNELEILRTIAEFCNLELQIFRESVFIAPISKAFHDKEKQS